MIRAYVRAFAVLIVVGWSGVAHATLTVTPAPAFGNVGVTAGPATINETIDNDNTGAVVLVAIEMGTGCGPFSMTASLPATINNNASVATTITFDPATRGAVTCNVRLVGALDATLGTVVLTGVGIGPAITVPATTDFGTVRVSTGAVQTLNVPIKNDGEQTLNVTSLSITGADYAINSPATPFDVAVGATTNVSITFDPSTSGPRNATLAVSSNDPVVPMATSGLTGVGGNAIVNVTDVSFADVTDNTTSTQNITITNTGTPTGPLAVMSATITGGSWFTFDNNGAGCAGQTTCTFPSLVVGTTPQTVAVRCSPLSTDPMPMQNATVTFTTDADSGDSVALLTCIAGRANIVLGTNALTFADQRVGTTSGAQTVTVANNGNRDLTYDVAKGGAFPGRYTLGGTCFTGCTVAPNTMSSFTVTFSPDAAAQQNAALAITNNDPDGTPASVTLTGKGIAPSINGPASVAFNNVEVGATSGPTQLQITNNGSAPLAITSAVVHTGNFAVATGNQGAQTVAVGATATWNLTCSPTVQGLNSGTFQITSDALNAPTLDVPLDCNGTRGFLEVDPTTLAFGSVTQDTTSTLNVTFRNTGNLPVTGITAVINPSTAGYTLVAAPPATLAAGGTTTLQVRFAPTATAAGGNASITFTGSWGTAPTATSAVLQLTGTRVTTGYTVSTATIAFGDFRYDTTPTRTFCITNTGQQTVTIQSPITFEPTGGTASNEFAVAGVLKQATCGTGGSTVTLPQSLATGEILQVTVRAQPANRTGPLTGNFKITSDLPANPDRFVAVSANSTSAMLAMVPGSTVNFGNVDIQGAPQQITVRIRNTGQAPMDVGSFTRTPNAAFTFALPTAQTIAPNAEATFVVTYTPTVALASDETVTITHSLAGDIALPNTGMIVLRGHPIDRDLTIVGLPLFPETFRNPGTQGPVRTVSVKNTGTAPLQISSVTSTMPDVWKVLDADAVAIPPDATMDIRVRFEPTTPGRADARLLIVNDDDDDGPPITPKTTEVDLSGNCVDRRVSFNPTSINVGYVEIGETITLTDILHVRSMDEANAFTITRIGVDGGDGAFTIPGAENVRLDRIAMERTFDVTFTPTTAGEITARAQLFLDEDPVHQSEIELTGTAVFVDARGGGGCSTGSGSGLGAIVLVLLFVLRRRAAVLALLLVPMTVEADDNVLLSVFDPTPQTQSDGFQLQSPVIGAHGTFALQGVFSYASDPLLHLASSGTEQGVITGTSMIELGGAIALLGKFELGASMPFYSQSGESLGDRNTMYTAPPAEGTATGDLRVHGKVGLLKLDLDGNGSFSVAGSIGLTVPTATDGMLAGVDQPSARVLALASLVPGAFANRITLSTNLGAIIRAAAEYKNLEQKSGVMWGLGASVRVADPLWVAAEMYGEFVPSGREKMDGSSAVLAPIEWLGGVRWRPDPRFTISVAAGRGLTSAAGAPALRGVFALTFTPYADAIKPINAPPPPKPDTDVDGDGIVDRLDKCENAPEDVDLFDDTDGCPDLDNDNDGVADAEDRCPLDPEDKDGFEDFDGCAEKDNDSDGIPDAMDKCPVDAEDKDGFQDADGCPEPDNDGDGVLDAMDKCPQQKEVINGNQDDDGCPDPGISLVLITLDRIDLMESIQFAKDKLKASSYNLLGQIGATLRARPDILRVRVAVHVAGTIDEAKDQVLSDKRAAAIKEWLVQWGIAEKRLDVRGFGSTKPLGGSAAADERVEIVIMEKK